MCLVIGICNSHCAFTIDLLEASNKSIVKAPEDEPYIG
jgi:hypothetical protein